MKSKIFKGISIGIGSLSVIVTLFVIGFPFIYDYTEKRNFANLREKSKLDCLTMPFHCAIDKDHLSDLSLLKSQGHNIESKDGNGKTALTRYLYSHQAVKTLLKLGANPNSTDSDGWDAITLALVDHKPYLESAELLIQYGADVNRGYLRQGYKKHMTLLGYAISHKNKALVTFLLKHGADPAIKDGYDYTACDRALIYQLKSIDQLNSICKLMDSKNAQN